MRSEEDKQRWKTLATLAKANSCEEIISSNNKEHIKWDTCGRRGFFCFGYI